MERKKWIDALRGFCMMVILWIHTSYYYVGYSIIPFELYACDTLTVFFFLSGYLIYKPDINYNKKIWSIARYILQPYFVFTSLIAIIKLIFGKEDLYTLFINVISGHASWFVAALIVAEVLFLIFLKISNQNILLLSVFSFICLLLANVIGNGNNPTSYYYEQDLWHINEALLAIPIMFIGYVYHKYDAIVQKFIGNYYALVILIVLAFISKIIIMKYDYQMVFGPVMATNYFFFVINIIISILLLVNIFRHLPSMRMIEWTGSHSIVYYFICGGVPLITSKVFEKVGIEYSGILSLICVYIVVYIICSAIAWLIFKYTPLFKRPNNL